MVLEQTKEKHIKFNLCFLSAPILPSSLTKKMPSLPGFMCLCIRQHGEAWYLEFHTSTKKSGTEFILTIPLSGTQNTHRHICFTAEPNMARQIIGGGFSDLLDLGSINMAQSVRNATLPAGQVILFVILSIRILLFLISPQTKPSCNKLQTSLAVKDNFEALGCPLKTIGRDIFRGS